MMIIWVLLEILFLFFFFSLPPVVENRKSDISDQSKTSRIVPVSVDHHEEDDKSDFKNGESIENSPLVGPGQIQSLLSGRGSTSYGTVSSNAEEPHKNCYVALAGLIKHFLWLVSQLIREEPVVLLSIVFISLFDNLTLEVSISSPRGCSYAGPEKCVSCSICQYFLGGITY